MAFSYNDEHQHPSLVEFGYLPCTPTEIPFLPQQSEDVTTSASSCFLHCYSQLPVADATGFGGSGSLDIAGSEPPSVANRVGHAPMVGEPGDGMAPKPQGSGEKKRKIEKDETSLITGQAKEGKISKQRRLRETDDKKPKADAMKASKTCGESPAGYIHVRARRGEATDSHSLAERVRTQGEKREDKREDEGVAESCSRLREGADVESSSPPLRERELWPKLLEEKKKKK
ncbi:hypothetical protein B296_00036375 [Ensete ventricosum]|uniref:Uncharacterized protein n=1 Tax=Ensete ventricosum TaxID=4639 RepID=A0A426XD27_ENSVE|nr:hypothetical protein B296_00036375 [Ensete ventricosum]